MYSRKWQRSPRHTETDGPDNRPTEHPVISVHDGPPIRDGRTLPTSRTNGADDTESPALASKINRLFETMHRKDDAPLSNAAAAEQITEKTGVPISAAYIWQLRAGRKTNPTVTHLQAIAEFFGVPPSYLIDQGVDPKVDAQLELLQSMRDAGVLDLAMRASGLTPESIKSLRAMIDQARRIEHLPPVNSPKRQQ